MSKQEFKKSETFDFSTSIEYASAAIVSKTIIKNPKGNVTLFAFDKGEELSEHTTPFDALVQVVDGKAEIIIDKKSYLLEKKQKYHYASKCTTCLKSNR